jgi:hypothetical protein
MQRGEAGPTVARPDADGDSSCGDQIAAIRDTTATGADPGAVGYRTEAGPHRSDIDPGSSNAPNNADVRTDRVFSAVSRPAGRVGQLGK